MPAYKLLGGVLQCGDLLENIRGQYQRIVILAFTSYLRFANLNIDYNSLQDRKNASRVDST
jgi:hypothetical protein